MFCQMGKTIYISLYWYQEGGEYFSQTHNTLSNMAYTVGFTYETSEKIPGHRNITWLSKLERHMYTRCLSVSVSVSFKAYAKWNT